MPKMAEMASEITKDGPAMLKTLQIIYFQKISLLRITDRPDFNICGTEFFGFPFFDENQLFEVF